MLFNNLLNLLKTNSFFDQVRPLSRAVTTTTKNLSTVFTLGTTRPTTSTTKGSTTTTLSTTSNINNFHIKSRGSSNQILYTVDHSFNRRLAFEHNQKRFQNPIYHTTSSPSTTSTYNSVQPTTTTTLTTRNTPTASERRNRTSSPVNNNSRVLQQYVRYPEEDGWVASCLQPETTQPIHCCPSFQNGNLTRSNQIDKKEQLSNLNRSLRCVPTYSCSSRITEVSSLSLARTNLPILYNPLWSVTSALAIHQTDKTNLGMGSYEADSIECLSGRLDYHCRFSLSSKSTHSAFTHETGILGLDDQLQEINADSNSTYRTPRLLIGYYNDDSATTGKEIERFTTQHPAGPQQATSVTTSSSQLDNANSSSNVRVSPRTTVHPTSTSNEESSSQNIARLGQASTTVSQLYRRTEMVEEQSASLEWKEHITTDPPTDYLRRCQQQRMGLQPTAPASTTNYSIWTLDTSRGTDVYQLARAQSSFSRSTNISQFEEYANSNPNGQHYLNGVYEQTRWNQIFTPDGISNRFMEMVPTTWNNSPINTHSRFAQHNSGFRITSSLSQEQLDDRQVVLSSDTTAIGGKRRGSVCGSNNCTTSKVRVLAARSGQPTSRRVYHKLEPISQPLLESTMEPNQPLPAEDSTGTGVTSNNGNSLVAFRTLVPNHFTNECQPTFDSASVGHPLTNTNSYLANDKQSLEARRLDIIASKFVDSNLNTNAKHILLDKYLENSSTNKSYKPGQHLFLQWASKHNVSPHHFTPTDLINFLSDMYTIHSYSISTIQLFRSAVTHLNHNPQLFRSNEDINSFITTLLRNAPPTRLHRPTISLQPSIDYLTNLSNDSFASLQRKLAFLLGFTCFLRPSDLHRIPFSSVTVSSTHDVLYFEVHKPKEKRGRRHIIKSFSVKAHQDYRICPVKTFLILQTKRPPSTVSTLFLNSLHPDQELSVKTIQSWISKLLKMSTSEKRVSLRSIASSLALQSGIPKEDVITMGNWASSSTFENHYRREHLSSFDFTNTLISSTMDQDSDEDVFFDAMDVSNLALD